MNILAQRPVLSALRRAPRPTGPATTRATATYRLRPRRTSDLGGCARLLGLVAADGSYPVPRPASYRGWLTAPDVLEAWVAERHGEVLGHVALTSVDGDPWSAMRWREVTGRPPAELAGVSRLFVRSRARGQGIGAALLATAVEEARARRLLPVAETVSPSRDGLRLYERQGWRLVARRPWGARDDARVCYLYVLPG